MSITPAVRISLGLVALTVGIVLVADTFLGLFPNQIDPMLEARKRLCESLAAQYSSLVEVARPGEMRLTMMSIAERTPDLVSIGLRSAQTGLVSSTPGHDQAWIGAAKEGSTPSHAQVPIFRGDERWGTLEVAFNPLRTTSLESILADPLYRLVGVVALAGFAAYLLFMKRTLRYLDPSSVVPGRVRAALDQLVEGTVLLDPAQRIVLSNTAFANKVGLTPESLVGTTLDALTWVRENIEQGPPTYPWEDVKNDGETRKDVRLQLQTSRYGLRTLTTNVSAIFDGNHVQRGVLATFDDISDLEQANTDLKETVDWLETAQDEIRRQNHELKRLAMEDPLTGCLNRRSFFEKFEAEFEIATRDGLPLTCIMADIDHFKSVNDDFGHGAGDVVIKDMADVLTACLGPNDAVGRYGGEEFCLLLCGSDIERGLEVANQARTDFHARSLPADSPTSGRPITSSFGVSTLALGAPNPAAMVDQADQALYRSKTTGRDRATKWSDPNQTLSQAS
jgi:diguanylate cyclase (GGDEF)-like protein/PAS domain S-box-containing protein